MQKLTIEEILSNQTDLVFNHTPQHAAGYTSVLAEVNGMDILISLAVIQTIIMIFILYFSITKAVDP